MFFNALTGLAIIVVAWAFTGVMETIFGFDILKPQETLGKFLNGGGGGGGCVPPPDWPKGKPFPC
jgi:hypothetical protein